MNYVTDMLRQKCLLYRLYLVDLYMCMGWPPVTLLVQRLLALRYLGCIHRVDQVSPSGEHARSNTRTEKQCSIRIEKMSLALFSLAVYVELPLHNLILNTFVYMGLLSCGNASRGKGLL